MSDEPSPSATPRPSSSSGVESANVSALTEDIRKMAEAYQASPELQHIMNNPLVPEARVSPR